MRTQHKTHERERLSKISDCVSLPDRVQVKIDLIDQHDSLRPERRVSTQNWVELRTANGQISNHPQEPSLAMAQTAERRRAAAVERDQNIGGIGVEANRSAVR